MARPAPDVEHAISVDGTQVAFDEFPAYIRRPDRSLQELIDCRNLTAGNGSLRFFLS